MKKTLLLFGSAALILGSGCTTTEQQTRYPNEPTYGGPPYSRSTVTTPSGTISYPRSGPTVSSTYPAQGSAATTQVMSQADLTLANSVRDQLNRYGDLATAAQSIQVIARNGAITLTGYVPSQRDRQLIDTVVRNTAGVTSVNDQLQISTTASVAPVTRPYGQTYGQADQVLANQLEQALANHPTLGGFASNIRIAAQNGRVTLTGNVPSEQDREMVDNVIRNTAGVVSVTDQLQISSVPTGRIDQTTRVYPADVTGQGLSLHVQGLTETDQDLAQRILDVIRADPTVTGPLQAVNINIANGRVTLDGTVPNAQQKRNIIAAVQRAAGVNAVSESIQVIPNS